VEHAYARARALCQRVGETPQLFSVLRGLWQFYNGRGAYQTAREVGEQCLQLAQQGDDTARLLEAHHTLWTNRLRLGELPLAHTHLEQGLALYNPQQHRALAVLHGHDPGVCCRSVAAVALWLRGYPDQALRQQHAAHTLAKEVAASPESGLHADAGGHCPSAAPGNPRRVRAGRGAHRSGDGAGGLHSFWR
jgi:predicted ATPase